MMLSNKAQFLLVIGVIHDYQRGDIFINTAAEALDLDVPTFQRFLDIRYGENLIGQSYKDQTIAQMNAGDFANFSPIQSFKEWDVEASYEQMKNQFESAKCQK